MANTVYDDELPKEGDSNAVSPETLKEREENPDQGSESQAVQGESNQTGTPEAEEQDDSASKGVGGGLYKAGNKNKSGLSAFIRRNRFKILLGGGAAGGVFGIGASIFFLLVPLKIETIATNLQNHFFASSQQAVENESQGLVARYMTRILPSYASCGSTIDKSCSYTNPFKAGTSNPVTKLYRTWAQARLENNLADRGVVFSYDRGSKIWTLKLTNTNQTTTIGTDTEATLGDAAAEEKITTTIEQQFTSSSKANSAFNSAVKDATKWNNIMLRFQAGRLIEEKYGAVRCVLFCGIQNSWENLVSPKINAAQLMIVNRVLVPRTKLLGVVLQCFLDPNCKPEQTKAPTDEPGVNAETTEPVNAQVDTAAETTLEEAEASAGIEDAADLTAGESLYTTFEENGIGNTLAAQFLEQLGLGTASKTAPVVGQVVLAANVIDGVSRAGPILKKLSYVVNAANAVQLYATYASYADEIHTGHVTATQLGQWTDTLGSGDHGTSGNPQVGGTESAEQTPLYSYLMNNSSGSSTSTSLLDSPLSGKAYAASSNSSNLTCSNGVAQNGLVCQEEVLGQGNNAANIASQILSLPGVSVVTDVAHNISVAANIVTTVVGGAFNFFLQAVGSAVTSDPALNAIIAPIAKMSTQVVNSVIQTGLNLVVANPFGGGIMSGGRTFDMMAAGADVMGNDYAHNTLGGKALNSTQTAAIITQQQDEAKQQFNQSPMFAKLFSTSSPYSFVSQLAMSMPLDLRGSIQTTLASIASNPLGNLLHSFAYIMPGFSAKTNAATTAISDPFNVTQYGYPSGSLPAAAVSDPETYWNNNCTGDNNLTTQWQNDAADPSGNLNAKDPNGNPKIDPNTGMPVNSTTDPCLLIQASAGSTGGIYNTNLLSPDEQQDLGLGQ